MTLLSCFLALTTLSASAFAQSPSSISAFDGLTPQGLQPGAPAGSYALSGLDTVNLYNGRMNFSVPLLQIGGRGEAGYTIEVPYSGEWDASATYCGSCTPNNAWEFQKSGWANWNYTYRPAGISMRQTGTPIANDAACPTVIFTGSTLTRLTVGLADGTEMEFRDAATQGAVETYSTQSCTDPHLNAFDRGKTWVSVDTSAATFMADNDIYDLNQGSAGVSSLTGTLYFRDGRIYHFISTILYYTSPTTGISGYTIDWIRDRNGNQTSFSYYAPTTGAQLAFTISDPLNRQTFVQIGNPYSFTDPEACPAGCMATYDQINSYVSPGGAQRRYYIYYRSYWFDRLSSLSGATWPTYQSLFGGYASPSITAGDWGISKIVLPDGNSYFFNYNQWGEIGRVVLPTGGAYEFDWTNGATTGNSVTGCPGPNWVVAEPVNNVNCLQIAVYRRLAERREYVNGGTGSSWSRKTDYTPTELNPGTSEPDDVFLGLCASSGYYCSDVDVTETDPALGVLASEAHYFYGAPSQGLFAPPGLAYPSWYSWWAEGKEFGTERTSPLRKQLQWWQQRPISGYWWNSSYGPEPAHDSRVIQTNALIENGKRSTRVVAYTTDTTNNVADVWEYDYGNTSGAQGLLIRDTHTDYVTSYNNLTTPVYLLSLPTDQIVYNPSLTMAAETQYYYDQTGVSSELGIYGNPYLTSFNQRGNLTTTTQWRNTGGPSATTTATYDQAGNVMSVTNPRGLATTYTYNDCGDEYAFVHTVTRPGSQTTTYANDCSFGHPTSVTDPNSVVTQVAYGGGFDPLDRLSKVTRASGIGLQNQTGYAYPNLETSTVSADENTYNDGAIQSTTVTDLFGRTVQTQRVTPQGTIYTQTDLDALGRASVVHSPAYMGVGGNLATYTYDAPGRATNVLYNPDGSQELFAWTGDVVVHTDPAGAKTQQQVDSQGRIVQVIEDPSGVNSATTNYTYDALNDLTGVTRVSQTRSFTYNSLKELISATNPETAASVSCNGSSVSVCYTYDADGNLSTKTAAAGTSSVQTSYAYDSLDRMTTKSYSDGVTPNVTYCYDGTAWSGSFGVCNGSATAPAIGRLTQVGSSASNTSTSYDQLGRVAGSTQNTGGLAYQFSYAYNLADGLTQETYPSGRAVSFGYDSAGRVMGVSGLSGSTVTEYAGNCTNALTNSCSSPIQYAAHGPISSVARGNGVTETWMYNTRLQPASTQAGSLMTLSYYYCPSGGSSCTTNNGNLARQGITRGSQSWTEDYVYDTVNRLASNQENGVSPDVQTYGYDGNGNWYLAAYNTSQLAMPTNETPRSSSWFGSNNQISSSGWTYDNAGNLTGISSVSKTFTYDAESRQTTAVNGGLSGVYTYDGDGRRVTKVVNAGPTTTYVYDAQGSLIAEYGGLNPIFGTTYVDVDHLGSTRLVTDSGGNQQSCNDYLPFGGDILSGTDGRGSCFPPTAPSSGIKFTGQERDAESSLDYFETRYFSGAQGRFASPDVSFNDQGPSDPQSWNLFSYVRNNPLRFTDPDGRACTGGTDEDGNPCFSTTGTGSAESVPYWYDSVLWSVLGGSTIGVVSVVQQAQQVGYAVVNALGNFRQSPNCAAGLTLGGAAAGAGVGAYVGGGAGGAAGFTLGSVVPVAGNAVGLAGGAALGSTGGALAGGSLGGALGGLAGGVFCSSGTWGGSGGGKGGDYRDKTPGANAKDGQNISDAARKVGVDRNAFGKYVDKMKKLEGRGPSDNFSFGELVELAEEFRAGGR